MERRLKYIFSAVAAAFVLVCLVAGAGLLNQHTQHDVLTPYQGHRTIVPKVRKPADLSRIVPQGGWSAEYRQARALERQAEALEEIARTQKAAQGFWFNNRSSGGSSR